MPAWLVWNMLALLFGPMLVLLVAWGIGTTRWWHDRHHQESRMAVGCDHCDRERSSRPDTP